MVLRSERMPSSTRASILLVDLERIIKGNLAETHSLVSSWIGVGELLNLVLKVAHNLLQVHRCKILARGAWRGHEKNDGVWRVVVEVHFEVGPWESNSCVTEWGGWSKLQGYSSTVCFRSNVLDILMLWTEVIMYSQPGINGGSLRFVALPK